MRRGRQAKLRAGTLLPWTTAPFGYRLDPERPRRADAVRTDPGEAALIAQLFDGYLEPGATIYQLAARLTDPGVPTPRGGPRWNVASVRGILRNPAYAGRALSNRTQAAPARRRKPAMLPAGPGHSHAPRPEEDWIAGPVPPIVSEEIFAQVQARLDANQQCAAGNTGMSTRCARWSAAARAGRPAPAARSPRATAPTCAAAAPTRCAPRRTALHRPPHPRRPAG